MHSKQDESYNVALHGGMYDVWGERKPVVRARDAQLVTRTGNPVRSRVTGEKADSIQTTYSSTAGSKSERNFFFIFSVSLPISNSRVPQQKPIWVTRESSKNSKRDESTRSSPDVSLDRVRLTWRILQVIFFSLSRVSEALPGAKSEKQELLLCKRKAKESGEVSKRRLLTC